MGDFVRYEGQPTIQSMRNYHLISLFDAPKVFDPRKECISSHESSSSTSPSSMSIFFRVQSV